MGGKAPYEGDKSTKRNQRGTDTTGGGWRGWSDSATVERLQRSAVRDGRNCMGKGARISLSINLQR